MPTASARSSLERFNLSLGAGLGRLKGRAFRIGHLGDFNELMLTGTLCGVEMGLAAAGVPFTRGRRRRRRWTSLLIATPIELGAATVSVP